MNGIAIALGLLSIPAIGGSVAEAFDALGGQAVFGPGCGDDGGKSIQAPARWQSAPTRAAAVLDAGRLTVMAELKDNRVRALHLARVVTDRMDAASCRARLGSLPGGAITLRHDGATDVYQRRTADIAGYAAHYRALFRPIRQDCRVMLTIG